MPRKSAFLTPQAKEALVAYIALNGENYEKYVAYATNQGWKLFSRRYLHNWVGRNRSAIQLERTLAVQKLRQVSMMDKQRRLEEQEVNAQQLMVRIRRAALDPDFATDELVKLMDMHRKLCQAIAVERGEWGVKEDGAQDLLDLHRQLQKNMERALKEPAVEGEFSEVTGAQPGE